MTLELKTDFSGTENKLSLPTDSGLSEQRIESLKKRYFMYAHFIEGVTNGRYRELTRPEIDKMVQENFFSFEPLAGLDQEQEALLRSQATERLTKTLNMKEYQQLSGPVLYDGKSNVYIAGAEERLQEKDRSKLKLLSVQEKADLYFNPQSLYRLRYNTEWGSSDIVHYGNRDLVGQGQEYFDNVKEFTDLIADVRQKTGVEKLAVLDIGCGMGKALQDMKDIDPNLETHGITQEQEPAMFDSDYFHYISAERFPAEFRNKFHFINSQISFRYFIFQHIALRNVLLSLAQGGFARLRFSYEAMHTNKEVEDYFRRLVPEADSSYRAMGVLVAHEMKKLDKLQELGKIKYVTSKNFRQNDNQGYLEIEKLEDFSEGDISSH